MNLREFASRRRHVLRMLDKDSVLLLPTAAEKTRNRDVHYPFRAESDFYYLRSLRSRSYPLKAPAC